MNLICPKCQAKSTVANERVPEEGAWGRCPDCRERFFIRPPVSEDAAESGAAFAQRRRFRKKRPPELPGRISLDGPGAELGLVTVFPESLAPDYSLFHTIGTIACLVVLGFALRVFLEANYEPYRRPASANARPVLEYGEEDVREDLIKLRRLYMSRNLVDYRVNYSGPESRVFNYYSKRLAPEMCSDVSELHLSSRQPAEEFRVAAGCAAGQSGFQPVLIVVWQNLSARINVQGLDGGETIVLFPLFEHSARLQNNMAGL